jgi:hypothetical protein
LDQRTICLVSAGTVEIKVEAGESYRIRFKEHELREELIELMSIMVEELEKT